MSTLTNKSAYSTANHQTTRIHFSFQRNTWFFFNKFTFSFPPIAIFNIHQNIIFAAFYFQPRHLSLFYAVIYVMDGVVMVLQIVPWTTYGGCKTKKTKDIDGE